jgi:cell fate regulator YaaT (PSP1 superfamily)
VSKVNINDPFITRGCRCAPNIQERCLNVFHHSSSKMDSTDWLKNIKGPQANPFSDFVEVRFKNSRKDFFRTTPDMDLREGDIVAVESNPGHDIGIVTLVGHAVKLQMRTKKVNPDNVEVKKVYRKAKTSDIEKWIASVNSEKNTMFKSREIALNLKLNMKISDVEYQGDKTKAIFYYTADERVDFRELIKVLAESFSVRIEMKQIGMRQEASRLGGIGSCGRELCCASWINNFKSVSTAAARTQQLSLNPQKLAGQCSKLKCCLNYENDMYIDALEDIPDTSIPLKTKKGIAYHQKTDIIKKLVWYIVVEGDEKNMVMISADRAKEILDMNKKGVFPERLTMDIEEEETPAGGFASGSKDDDSLTRFDQNNSNKKKRKKKSKFRKESKPNFNKE